MPCGYAVETDAATLAERRRQSHPQLMKDTVLQCEIVFLGWFIWTVDLHGTATTAKVGHTLPCGEALVLGMETAPPIAAVCDRLRRIIEQQWWVWDTRELLACVDVAPTRLRRMQACGGELVVLGTRLLSGSVHGCCLHNLRESEEQKEVLEVNCEGKESEVDGEVEERESLNVRIRHDE